MLLLALAPSLVLAAAAAVTLANTLATASPQQSSGCDGRSCPLSLFPKCHAQADLCTSQDWYERCGPGRSFVTTEKWKFCHWSWYRNILADAKHCGRCRAACPPDLPHCVSGVCRSTPGVVVNLRIEGNSADGTLFDGQVATTAHNMSASQTDSHECPGPNAPSYASVMSMMDDATRLNGMDWDGIWYQGVEDWEIWRIGNSTNGYGDNGAYQHWTVRQNFVSGNRTGWPCRDSVGINASDLWLWGFYEGRDWAERTLELAGPAYARLGDAVTYTVTSRSNFDQGANAPGVQVRDRVTDEAGKVTFTFNQSCIFHLRASKQDHIRSNSIWTTVW